MFGKNTNRILASLALMAITMSHAATASAATQIGSATVSGDSSFDSAIMWDDSFPGTASGSVSNITVTATVVPSLNMELSASSLNLGTLNPDTLASDSIFIEIGTNAKSGVSVSARSNSGGLTHTTESGVQINNLTTDGLAESYTWASNPNETDDSSSLTYAASGMSSTEINDNTTEHVIYSTNKGESSTNIDDVEFVVSAQTSYETPAGNYEDNIIFTVTGNF